MGYRKKQTVPSSIQIGHKLMTLFVLITCLVIATTSIWADSENEQDGPDTQNKTMAISEGKKILDGWNKDKTQYFVDGKPITGFFTVDGKRYYANKNGYIAKGNKIIEVDSNKYMVISDVIRTTFGVKEFKGNLYIIYGSDGRLAKKGMYEIQGKTYHVQSSGVIYKGIHTWNNGCIFYSDENGVVRKNAGFITYKDSRYYAQKGGYIVSNEKFEVNGNTFFAAKDGKLRTGLIKWGSTYYYANSNYAMQKSAGFVYANDHKYFNQKGGGIKTSSFLRWDKKYYYAGKTGIIATSPFKCKKTKVHPNPNTGVISEKEYKKATGKIEVKKAKKYSKSPYKYRKYVLIDISDQKLVFYKNGKKKMKCKVVTGNVSTGHRTPTGIYSVRSKARGVTLRGRGYASYVNYWMPFIGNSYGMHDASWRSSFGGKIYKRNGSHGCVNMPYWAARKLYYKVSVGTPVVIRK